MSDIVSDDELNALAAEYVLGTLDYEERSGASALIEVDPAFRGIVRIWERRFGDLHLMVEAVEPDPQIWARIKPKVPGVEQDPLAIPSNADPQADATPTEAAPAQAVPAQVVPAQVVPVEVVPVEVLPVEAAPGEAVRPVAAVPAPAAEATPSAPARLAEPPKAEPRPADDTQKVAMEAAAALAPAAATEEPASTMPAESRADAAEAAEAVPAVDEPTTEPDKPSEAGKPTMDEPAAITEAKLKLAELAALLPASTEQAGSPALTDELPGATASARDAEQISRGFVPPAPMSTRGAPTVVEVPVHKGGRGWMAATLTMGLLAAVLAGLIGAWRFFPERLPDQLRVNSVLNLSPSAPPPATPKAVPKPPPFDE